MCAEVSVGMQVHGEVGRQPGVCKKGLPRAGGRAPGPGLHGVQLSTPLGVESRSGGVLFSHSAPTGDYRAPTAGNWAPLTLTARRGATGWGGVSLGGAAAQLPSQAWGEASSPLIPNTPPSVHLPPRAAGRPSVPKMPTHGPHAGPHLGWGLWGRRRASAG